MVDHRKGAREHQHGQHPMHGIMELMQQGQRAIMGLSQHVQQWASNMQRPGRMAQYGQIQAPSLAVCVGANQCRPGQVSRASKASSVQLPIASMSAQVHAGNSVDTAARKAELGKATWTLLHMLAAQYPDKPTGQQRRDAKELINCLTRIYPCADCASHFQQIVK